MVTRKSISRIFSVLFIAVLLLTGVLPVQAEAPVNPLSARSDFLWANALATTWYVATSGNDLSSCSDPAFPCFTLQAALDKAVDGDTIYIAEGIYNATNGTDITKDLTILGGWNSGFSLQTGFSTFDGGGNNYGLFWVMKNAVLERLILQNANQALFVSDGGPCPTLASAVLRQVSITGMKFVAIMNCGTLTITNSTLSGNHGTFFGAIYNFTSTLVIQNSTITNNTGGIKTTGTTTTRNSIIAGNFRSDGEPLDCDGATTSLGNNIIGTGCYYITPQASDQIGVDPKLGYPLPTGYISILPDSPAVDAGDFASCPPVDQRGVSRPQGSSCDIGAYEYTSPGEPTSFGLAYGSNQSIGPSLPFSLPLAVYVLDAIGTPVSNVDVVFSAPVSGASGIFPANGSNTITVPTNDVGLAIASFTANSQLGIYSVSANAPGLSGSASFDLTNTGWFVASTGDDANSCDIPNMPCHTINAAINKAPSGGSILVTGGTYTASGEAPISQVVLIEKSITLSGGWNSDYTLQNEASIIDGQTLHRGVTINAGIVVVDNFIIQNGGGGFAGGGIQNLGQLTINNSIIRNNTGGQIYSSGINGGGIKSIGGKLTLNNSVVTGNTVLGSAEGSGIYSQGNDFTINNSSITNNTGAAAISLNGTLIMNNSTVGGNIGGGIQNRSGTVIINHSTITGNSGQGGVYGIITMGNSILAGNKNNAYGSDCYGTLNSSGYNIIGNNEGCVINSGTGDQIGTAANPIDPLLSAIPLKPFGHYALFAGSPAIDAANSATCPAVDQRGVARPQGAGCDIGAYEFGTTLGAATYLELYDGSDQQSYQGRTFGKQLAAYVVDNQGTPVSGQSVTFTAPAFGASGKFSDSTITTLLTNTNGFATAPLFRANYEVGSYMVTASTSSVANMVNYSLKNLQVIPDYIQNGNLEDSTLGNYWWQYSTNFGTPVCTIASCGKDGGKAGPHSGTTWSWFGDAPYPLIEAASISQSVVIPSGPAPVYLRFYLWIGKMGSANSTFTVTIDGSSTPVFSVNAAQQSLYSSYKLEVLDLSQYANGDSHNITFRGLTAAELVNFNLDDISLNVATFGDVPSNYWAWQHIDRLSNTGITGGCTTIPLNYCPTTPVTRAQMAIFLLRGMHGSAYTPPPATGTKFADVPLGTFGAAWIEQLAAEGITSGCGGGNYCPNTTVSRAQMAIFLVRAKHGSTFVPPTATGVFGDVPIGSFGANFIEQLVTDAITSGCSSGNFCPNTMVKRDSMAVFLVKTFNLP